jgi:hypothetical protein
MTIRRWLIVIVAGLLVAPLCLQAQVTGGEPGRVDTATTKSHTTPRDTLFIFTPARPLIDSASVTSTYEDVLGFDLLFSASGLGAGGYYLHKFSPTLAGFVNIGATGSRNTDEFPRYDTAARDNLVPGKINRLYTFPLTVGLHFRVFDEVLVDNFRPYVNLGVGPSLIVALPYDYEFFRSLGHATGYLTGGGFIGVGAEIGGSKPLLGVNVRYFYIPLNPGIESIRGNPMTDFGGLFLTMNVGFPR